MNTTTARVLPRRISVVLDADDQDPRLLGLIAGMAAALEAELEGVFVENDLLLRAVGLPFVREFRLTTRAEAGLDAARLQQELRAVARRARASLQASAQHIGCAWSFRVWRGDVEGEILSAVSTAEMFLLTPRGRFAPSVRGAVPPLRLRPDWRLGPRSGSRAGAMAGAQAEWPDPRGPRIGVLFDGSAGATRALSAAAQMARQRPVRLEVLQQAQDAEDAERQRRQARTTLGELADDVEMVPLVSADTASIPGGGTGRNYDLLMLDADSQLLQREPLWQSLARLHCPLLIVR
ncbi:universal stress protein [Thiohalocapsa marina]|uniref:Universal stress protein n=1 Tax=Thiohalocapsa marina TaxID=424902 RepID=A0A5M8FH23_9GAMM|nr:universal stress protein [Thiohalocapsa marina]KAA6184178.1 universal stress protein [Thiohalocapsa marina]